MSLLWQPLAALALTGLHSVPTAILADTEPYGLPHHPSACDAALQAYSAAATRPVSTPPPTMPRGAAFTMGGAIETGEFFVDDTLDGHGSAYSYGAEDVEAMVAAAGRAVKGGGGAVARPMDRWLLEALAAHPIEGGDLLVFGSMEPWYEAIAVAAGAARVTTAEYNRLRYHHPRMHQFQPRQLPHGPYDFALSISSFEHDGLGRYGDPVSPVGDLQAMSAAMCLVRPGGLLFLTVPVGPDVVVWNLHRRYGRVRLPHLLRGWELLAAYGWDAARLDAPADWRRSYEPVLVLRRPAGRDGEL